MSNLNLPFPTLQPLALQNHRKVWVGRDFIDCLVPTRCHGQASKCDSSDLEGQIAGPGELQASQPHLHPGKDAISNVRDKMMIRSIDLHRGNHALST